MSRVRPAAVAGMFYARDEAALRHDVRTLLTNATEKVADLAVPKAVVVPHAGYIYSGCVAGLGYGLVARAKGTITRVVVLGPCHRVAVRGIALPDADAFASPLGDIRLDTEAMASIADLPCVVTSREAHAQEHSLEVQVPFIQEALGDVTLVPLAVGSATPAEVASVIDALWGGPETLIVISSDLSHYLPYAKAQRIDAKTIEKVLALDGPIESRSACGAGPLNGLLHTARARGMRTTLIGACNSGDTAGDRNRVVGYAAIGFEEAS